MIEANYNLGCPFLGGGLQELATLQSLGIGEDHNNILEQEDAEEQANLVIEPPVINNVPPVVPQDNVPMAAEAEMDGVPPVVNDGAGAGAALAGAGAGDAREGSNGSSHFSTATSSQPSIFRKKKQLLLARIAKVQGKSEKLHPAALERETKDLLESL